MYDTKEIKAGFFEQGPGKKSMMRLLAFLGFILGGLVTVWGLILITLVVVDVLNGDADSIGLIGSLSMLIISGLGLAGGGELLKMIQKKSEIKESGKEGNYEEVNLGVDMGNPGNSNSQRGGTGL